MNFAFKHAVFKFNSHRYDAVHIRGERDDTNGRAKAFKAKKGQSARSFVYFAIGLAALDLWYTHGVYGRALVGAGGLEESDE